VGWGAQKAAGREARSTEQVWVENSDRCFMQYVCAESVTMNLSGRMVWVLRGLCAAGLGISVYLAWTALSMKEVYGCSGSELFDCNHVLKSKWSKVFGLPVSIPAAGLYASLLVLLSFVRRPAPVRIQQLLWNCITVATIMAGLAALWFVGLQVFVLRHLCPYCLAVHSCGLILAGLLFLNRITTWQQKGAMSSIAVASVGLMIAVQVVSPEPQNFEVVRYDDVAEGSDAGESSELLAAPDEVFAAPGDVFEAPGDIFEAPGSEPVAGKPESTEAVKADSSPAVTATLLMIVPPQMMRLGQMFLLTQDTADTSTTTEQAAPGDPVTKSDPSKPIEGTQPAANPNSSPEPAKEQRRLITVAGNRVTLDVKQWPLIGNPDARYIFVEMYDYTCPHCRNTQHAIKGAMAQYGDDLAIVVLPVPLDSSCNDAASGGGHAGACDLAKIAVAVWRADPVKFREFHEWVFSSHATPMTARAKAEQMVGAERFRKEYASKTPSEYVRRHVELYKKVGRGSVPKLMFPKSTINGEMNSVATLCSTIERELGSTVRE
jgi:uncharacterized membrane protein/protein-disulfide isomerase